MPQGKEKSFARASSEGQSFAARTRLYVEEALKGGGRLSLGAKESHYLAHVLRMKEGDRLRAFNARDGEWSACVLEGGRASLTLEIGKILRAPEAASDLWLLSAPIKNPPMTFLIRQAVEMGVSYFQPILTKRAVQKTPPTARLRAAAIAAAQQSERLSIPELGAPLLLPNLLQDWKEKAGARQLLFCDEALACDSPLKLIETYQNKRCPWAVLIGPEGGFAPEERDMIKKLSFSHPISLGPRLLRAETAAVAALTLFQSLLGDWRRPHG